MTKALVKIILAVLFVALAYMASNLAGFLLGLLCASLSDWLEDRWGSTPWHER